jgi:exopolysaccharide biosynthesis polyprenyl glycosylphosphotransferase
VSGRPVWTRWSVAPLLVTIDLLGLLVAVVVGHHAMGAALSFVGLTSLLLAAGGLYRSRLSLSVLDDLPPLLGRCLTAAGLVVLVSASTSLGPVAPSTTMAVALSGAAGLVAGRAASYHLVRAMRRRGTVSHRTLIYGAGAVGVHIAGTLLHNSVYGLKPVGFVDAEPLHGGKDDPLELPLLGDGTDLAAVLGRHEIGVVVIAFTSAPESSIVDIIRQCDRLDCDIFYIPRLFELHHRTRDVEEIWGIPVIRLRRATHRSPIWPVKRALDMLVAATLLVLLSPFMLACAVAVRLECGRGVIYRQRRVGLDGRQFELLKFRTLRSSDNQSDLEWSIAADGRVAPVGRFLRKTSLDELPQLVNVLRGQMSLVGPRPERPFFVQKFTESMPRYTARHRVPAGLTGWAQVHGLRGDTSIQDRLLFDNYYIENWSLWSDIKILLRTTISIFTRSGS